MHWAATPAQARHPAAAVAANRGDKATQLRTLRDHPEDVQAVLDLHVLDLAEIAVEVLDQRRGVARLTVDPQVIADGDPQRGGGEQLVG